MQETKEGITLFNKAIRFLYTDGYDAIVNKLKNAQVVHETLAEIVLNVVTQIEKQNQEITIEIVAEVGFKLLSALIEDMAGDGVVEISDEDSVNAVGKLLSDYAHAHNIPEAEFQQFLSQLQQQGEQEETGQQVAQEEAGQQGALRSQS